MRYRERLTNWSSAEDIDRYFYDPDGPPRLERTTDPPAKYGQVVYTPDNSTSVAEVMWDQPSKGVWHPCLHSKLTLYHNKVVQAGPFGYADCDYRWPVSAKPTQTILYRIFRDAYARFESKTIKAREIFRRYDFSIWFVVRDIVELALLWPQIRKILLKFRDLIPRGQSLGQYYGTISGTLRNAASAKLLYDFGIAATVRDLVELYEVLMKFRQVLKQNSETVYRYRLEESSERVVYTHRGAAVYLPPYGLVALDDSSLGYDSSLTRTDVWRSIVHSCYFTLDYGGGDWMWRFAQLFDRLGVLNLNAIWDVIPFSFVLDWFIPIGEWLEDNSPKLSVLALRYEGSIYSIKTESICTLVPADNGPWWLNGAYYGPASTFDPEQPYPVTLARAESYARFPYRAYVDFSSLPVPDPRALDTRIAITAGCLILQRLPSWHSIRGGRVLKRATHELTGRKVKLPRDVVATLPYTEPPVVIPPGYDGL